MSDAASDLTLAARTDDGPDRFAFATVDGVCSPEKFRVAELLLAEALWDDPPTSLLVPQANYGVVGTVLAGAVGRVTMTESSARSAACCRKNVRRNVVDGDMNVSLLAALNELRERRASTDREPQFDAVAYAPKPYVPLAVSHQRIADALELLAPGGRCLVAAEPTTGLARYRETLEALGGSVETVEERDGVSVLEATRSQRAADSSTTDRSNYVEPRTLEPTVDGVELELVTVPGLFAANELDHGTRLLIETLDVPDGARVLDACCGYGPIGTYAAASDDCEVWLTDDDRIATRCAECSLERTGVEGAGVVDATVVTGDCTEGVADRSFDLVATNPPTHAGSGVLSELFAGIHAVLDRGGECLFVRHEALDLSAHLRSFSEVETVARGVEHVVRRALP
ncbi:hypothetical protein GCM10028857_15310 [Salinarchaeum chitinilyticum]